MNTWTKDDLQRQLHHAKTERYAGRSLFSILHDEALNAQLPVSLVLAVASRETNVRNIRGDKGHGYGPMQLDDRSHHIPPNWREDPTRIVAECCALLSSLLQWARIFPKTDQAGRTKIALAAYNAGRHAAAEGHTEGDADAHDTGRDYGRDTLGREKVFTELLAGA